MSDVNAAFRKIEVQHGDKTFVVSRPTFETEGAFSAWLQKRSAASIGRLQGQVVYRDALAEFVKQLNAGLFGWEEEICRMAVWTADGMKELLYYIVTQNNPSCIDRGGFEQLWEVLNTEAESHNLANPDGPIKRNTLMEAYLEAIARTPTTPPAVGSGANA